MDSLEDHKGFGWSIAPSVSGVAKIWCKEGHETKRKQFKADTQTYFWNSCDKQRQSYRREYFLLDRKPHGVQCQEFVRLWSDQKIKQLEVEGESAP